MRLLPVCHANHAQATPFKTFADYHLGCQKLFPQFCVQVMFSFPPTRPGRNVAKEDTRIEGCPPPLSNLSVRTTSAKWFLQRGLHHTHTYSDGLRYECKQHLIFSASASTKGRKKSRSILPALFKCSSTKTGAIPATNFSSSCPSSACKPATEVVAIWKIHSLQIQKALISKIP